MNLQIIYDIKDRLEKSAIAGTRLLNDDFRLKRSAEELKKLAEKIPVFSKIAQGLDSLFNAKDSERANVLLDVLALVDAVVYTQANIGIEGEMEPISGNNGDYFELSYCFLNPLLDALSTSGGGKKETITSYFIAFTEYFSDYRIVLGLIDGLNDSYGEKADLCADILSDCGANYTGLLKKGFDPKNQNKSMARYIDVIRQLEGKAATPWLIEILPEVKGQARLKVLYALGEDEDNINLLLDLTKTERGDCREAILGSLAKFDGEVINKFWTNEILKHEQSVFFLSKSNQPWAIDIVVKGLKKKLETLLESERNLSKEIYDSQYITTLHKWCVAIGYKNSVEMQEVWKWIVSNINTFKQIDEKDGSGFRIGIQLSEILLKIMLKYGEGPLCDFCAQIFDEHKDIPLFLHISFLASLISKPADEVYKKFSPYVLKKKVKDNDDYQMLLNDFLLISLKEIEFSKDSGDYVVEFQKMKEPLDRRWIKLFAEALYTNASAIKNHKYYHFYYGIDNEVFIKRLRELVDPSDKKSSAIVSMVLKDGMLKYGNTYEYARWILELGGNPKDVLLKSMKVNINRNNSQLIWEFLNRALYYLPEKDVIDMLKEIAASSRQIAPNSIYLKDRFIADIDYMYQQFKDGKHFPSWKEVKSYNAK